jgi:hypothetical protein
MIKVDFKKELKNLYNPSVKVVSLLDVPQMNFVMIDGAGDPNTAAEYVEAIEALYAVSYTLKFTVKKEQSIDYGVLPLEGLWWTDDMSHFATGNKDIWKWTAMIMQPEYISETLFNAALDQVQKKKNLPALPKARFENFREGLSAQIMYMGPYSAEGPVIQTIHQFIRDNKGVFNGLKQKHHEIYLSDPRRTAPEKLRTIIRQPFVRV